MEKGFVLRYPGDIVKKTVISCPQLIQRSEGLPWTDSWAKVQRRGIEIKCTLFSNSSHIIQELIG